MGPSQSVGRMSDDLFVSGCGGGDRERIGMPYQPAVLFVHYTHRRTRWKGLAQANHSRGRKWQSAKFEVWGRGQRPRE
jgi:hypothetical protein